MVKSCLFLTNKTDISNWLSPGGTECKHAVEQPVVSTRLKPNLEINNLLIVNSYLILFFEKA